jgi:RNA polymerase sigma-70 factor (ECF subfamily)
MKISYEFVTGEIVEIEVPENITKVSIEIDRDIYNHNRKETRRHNSIDYMEDTGLQFEDNSVDLALDLEQKEVIDEIEQALDILLPEQKELIEKVFYKNMKIVDIAATSGVTEAAVRNRLKKIYKKLKKVLI